MKPPALPPQTLVVSDRVFLYAIASTMAVCLFVALGFGVFTLLTWRELTATREALAQTKENAAICHDALLKSEAKREQITEMLELASARKRAPAMGGGD